MGTSSPPAISPTCAMSSGPTTWRCSRHARRGLQRLLQHGAHHPVAGQSAPGDGPRAHQPGDRPRALSSRRCSHRLRQCRKAAARDGMGTQIPFEQTVRDVLEEWREKVKEEAET